jgi:hypothetical protein
VEKPDKRAGTKSGYQQNAKYYPQDVDNTCFIFQTFVSLPGENLINKYPGRADDWMEKGEKDGNKILGCG